jgi:general secretion pathway protein K
MKHNRQKGAALAIVLLLAATLAVVVAAVAETTSHAAARSTNIRARAELHWLALGAETLALKAVESAARAKEGQLTDDNALLRQPLKIELENGEGSIEFVDRTRCFNVNTLSSEDAALAADAAELAAVFDAAGVTDIDVDGLASTAADWIDSDSFQTPRGAEDDHYLGLPIPYRTGAGPLADRSELRAMRDVGQETYAKVRPWLCALPSNAPMNINLLQLNDAPLLVGLLKGAISESQARQVIGDRPPGGNETVEAFWRHAAFAGKEIREGVRNRVGLTSRFLEARARLRLYDSELQADLLIELENGRARVLRRRYGPES